MPLAILIATTMPASSEALSNKVEAEQSRLQLRTDSYVVVSPVRKISEIIPGESAVLKEARLKAEAEAETKKAAEQAAEAARNTVSRESNPVKRYSDPSDFSSIYRRAGSAFGVDPRLLQAIHIVETGASGSTSRSSYAGAVGPMQFLPSTFRRYAVDGNGNGVTEITNVEDAIFSAARYLKACGYPDVKKALWGYNPSATYYNKVMRIAQSLGM